jgi:hypothetical protein
MTKPVQVSLNVPQPPATVYDVSAPDESPRSIPPAEQNQGHPANGASALFVASSEARGLVGPPVVVTVGPKHPLFDCGVHEPPRPARRVTGPAFARREVAWPRSAETRVSPYAGKRDSDRADLLAHERRAVGVAR